MSGVYIYEVSPRKEGERNIVKIGSTRDCLEKRVHDSFNENFNKKDYSYYIIELIPCNQSIAINLENYLRNQLREIVKPEQFKGREFFFSNQEEVQVLIDVIPDLVLNFYNFFRNYTSFELSVGNLVRFKRKKLGYTQQYIADETGLRQATISEIENGKIGNFATLKKVIACLDISLVLLDNEKQNSLVMLNN